MTSSAEPGGTPPLSTGRPDNFFIQFARALAFLLGAAAFVAANLVLYLMANPSWPNPGDQPDIRWPLAIVVVVALAITFVFGRAGRAFGLGFGTGLVAETIFMGWCTAHWVHPGGTALARAEYERQRPMQEARAQKRAKERWIREVRKRGLHLGKGFSHLRITTGCLMVHRRKQGDYPPAKDSLPDVRESCYDIGRLQRDESGWRILYTRTPGKPEDPSAGFQVRAGPDIDLRLPGPFLETNDRGLILRRDSAKAPAFAAGSPLQIVTKVVVPCILKGSLGKPESPTKGHTLRDLVFGSSGCTRIELRKVKMGNDVESPDPNVARLWIPASGPYVGIAIDDIATIWDLTYVPHGKKPEDGYDLHVRPMRYGETGIRSYQVSGDAIYVTWEDRRATPSDPLAELCERDVNAPCN